MVLTIPLGGFDEPSTLETFLYVILNWETWLLAVLFAAVSLSISWAISRFWPLIGRRMALCLASLTPLLCLELAALISALGHGTVSQSILAAAFSDLSIAFELGLSLLVGILVSIAFTKLFARPAEQSTADIFE
jgi:hypothetical protein